MLHVSTTEKCFLKYGQSLNKLSRGQFNGLNNRKLSDQIVVRKRWKILFAIFSNRFNLTGFRLLTI